MHSMILMVFIENAHFSNSITSVEHEQGSPRIRDEPEQFIISMLILCFLFCHFDKVLVKLCKNLY